LAGERKLLEHGQPIDDGEVRSGSHRVEIAGVVRRVRGEVAEVESLDGRVLRPGQLEVVRGQPVAEAATARVHLHVEVAAANVLLELDDTVATAQGAELTHAPLGP